MQLKKMSEDSISVESCNHRKGRRMSTNHSRVKCSFLIATREGCEDGVVKKLALVNDPMDIVQAL